MILLAIVLGAILLFGAYQSHCYGEPNGTLGYLLSLVFMLAFCFK